MRKIKGLLLVVFYNLYSKYLNNVIYNSIKLGLYIWIDPLLLNLGKGVRCSVYCG